MERGKKSLAERVFYKAMDLIEQRTGQPGVNVFKQALSNVKPALEVKSRRVGGATYQVPVEVRPERRTALGMRDRKSTRLNSSHLVISYAVFCLKKKKKKH